MDAINLGRRDRAVTLARKTGGGHVAGKRIAILGAAFKPDSDDIRDSPSLEITERLSAEGRSSPCTIRPPCPTPGRNAPTCAPRARCRRRRTADLVLHLTERSDYRAIDPAALAEIVGQRVTVDARCALDAGLWREAGWTVHALGRS